MNRIAGAAMALSLFALPLAAQEDGGGHALLLEGTYLRATAPAAKVGGGYLTIVNNGSEADRLVGGSAAFAGKVEVHEMKMDGATMVMRPVAGGLEIGSGATVELKPGGYHLMFMQLREQLKAGEKRDVVLRFEKAGDVEIQFDVLNIGEAMGQTN